jgi:hypothetical protein
MDATTATSAGLAASLSDETGSGSAVFATSPTLVTPALGTPSALVLTSATGGPETMLNPISAEGLHPDRVAIFDYDFATDAVFGAITTGVNLPAKAVIEKAYFRIETQLTDAGSGTLAVSCEDANNILTAADQTGVAGGVFLASNITGASATMVDDIAATCDITITIAGASLTAGKFRGFLHYQVHP